MDTYYAILNDRIVALTRADSIDEARDNIELALVDEDIVDTDDLDITRFARNAGTIVLDLES
jgi:hypothetical protein